MPSLPSQIDIKRYAEISRIAATGLIRIGQLMIDIGQTVHQTSNAVDKAAGATVSWSNSEVKPERNVNYGSSETEAKKDPDPFWDSAMGQDLQGKPFRG